MVQVNTLTYNGREYQVADIPDVFTNRLCRLLVGSNSLNAVLYDEEHGYYDSTAEEIDEQIYAYLDDHYFSLGERDFLAIVKKLLD